MIEAIEFPSLQAALDALPPTCGLVRLPAGVTDLGAARTIVEAGENAIQTGFGRGAKLAVTGDRLFLTMQLGGPSTIWAYDLAGRRIRVLVQESLAAGRHHLRWSGRDQRGRRVASGIYLVRVSTPEGTATARVLLSR